MKQHFLLDEHSEKDKIELNQVVRVFWSPI